MFITPKGKSLAGLACAAVLVLSLSSLAAPITITLVPTTSAVTLNSADDPLVLTIQISNPDQLVIKSWSLDLVYNPAVFQPIPAVGTVPGCGLEVGTYITGVTGSFNAYLEHNGGATDVARATVFNFAGTTSNAASGVLGKVAFDAIALGDNATFSLGSLSVITLNGTPPQSATGVVYNSATVSVTPEPGCLGLLLVGAMSLIWRRR